MAMMNFHRQILLFVIVRFSLLLLVPSPNSGCCCWSFSFPSYFGGGRKRINRHYYHHQYYHHDGRHHQHLSSSEEEDSPLSESSDRAGSKDDDDVEDGEIIIRRRNNHDNNNININIINPPQFLYNAEVVGGFGRMGSFWLCHHNNNNNNNDDDDDEEEEEDNDREKAVAVIPRGISPGYLSPLGCPIYIATPSKSWIHTFEQIPINRRCDCVFVGNGIPSNQFINTTIIVPHYAILQVCRRMSMKQRDNTTDDDDDYYYRNDTTAINNNNNQQQQQQQQPATVVTVTTSSQSPKTFIYGKHAIHTAKVLQRHGVSTQIIDNFHNIQALAGQKLLWASCLWLVCHHHHHHHHHENNKNTTTTTITGKDNDDPTKTPPPPPLTVSQAHEYHQDMLDRLLEELLPALEIFVKQKLDIHSVRDYMKSYSQSIPDAIPSKALALSELEERNGVWLKLATKVNPQLFHQQLLRQVTTTSKEEEDDDENSLFNLQKTIQQQRVLRSSAEEEKEEKEEEKKVGLDLNHIHLTAWGKERRHDENDDDTKSFSKSKHISIVGGGIIGSAMALFLGQRLHPDGKIIVFDNNHVQTSSSPHGGKNDDDDSSSSVGKTTPASWAWINANSKSPKSYQILNLLGIHAWKHERNLSNLPSWLGSLVRFEDYPDFVNDGGLPVEGPLSNDRILELEPYCNWKLNSGDDNNNNNNNDNSPPADAEEGYTFHFPDEACVDPTAAVQALRKAAQKLGNVQFVNNRNVTNIIRDHQTGKIFGIVASRIINGDNEEEKEEEFIETDLVISAAGTGASAPFLGGIPLLHRPGQIAYAYPTSSEEESSSSEEEGTTRRRLSKILVDPLRSSHLLQRPDGSLVAGGGALEVGGSSGTVKVVRGSSSSESSTLLDGAMELSPTIVGSAKLSHTSSAVRPMPADGLPVVGYVDQGLYVIVTHSGITLGPILASLAAGEILENINCDLLQDYRPSRLLNHEQQ